MSFVSASKDAHETLAICPWHRKKNIGAKSINTGEGGEDEERFTPDPTRLAPHGHQTCVRAAFWGVTANYLSTPDYLQIKNRPNVQNVEGVQLRPQS